MRRLMVGAILASTVAGATCLLAQSVPGGANAMPAPGAMPDPNKAIATINGKDINNKAFNDILMQVAGMRVFQQVFDLSLVQNACANAGIALTGKEFQDRLEAEYKKTLESLNLTFPPADKLPGTQPADIEKKNYENSIREQALNQVLQRQGVTAVEFRIGLETRANLRAMSANAHITVTDDEVTDAYNSEYGEKRTVHIFVLNDTVSENAVRNALLDNAKKPAAEQKSAEDIAAANKWPQPASWTISYNAKGIDDIMKVAFGTMKEGDVSTKVTVKPPKEQPEAKEQNVIIKVDKVTPETKTVNPRTAALSASLKQKVQDFKEGQWMNNQLAVLRNNAAVQINDPILQEQFKNISEAMKRQAEAAAMQPGMTGTAPAMSAPATPAKGGMVIPAPAK